MKINRLAIDRRFLFSVATGCGLFLLGLFGVRILVAADPPGPKTTVAPGPDKSPAGTKNVQKDMEALKTKLATDPKFAAQLRKSLEENNVAAATKLVQSTATVCSIKVTIEGPANKGHFCWYDSNGIRKCLWYDDCCPKK